MTFTLPTLLSKVGMYRQVLYFLIALWVFTILLSLLGLLSYDPLDLALSSLILGIACNAFNLLLAKTFGAQPNLESASITALILTLIIGPIPYAQIGILLFISLIAMASKYILAIHNRHVFNPAAVTALISGVALSQGASWWVGGLYTNPLIIIGGIYLMYSIRRWPQVVAFLAIYAISLVLLGQLTLNAIIYSPLWFFVFIMLTEPLTSPSISRHQYVFGGLVAVSLVALQRLIPSYPYAIETALLIGNLYTFTIARPKTIGLKFIRKQQIAPETWAFYFDPTSKLNFTAGQFLEITLPHPKPDHKGFRRYVSIASSPNQAELMIAMRMGAMPSSLKQALLNLKSGNTISASGPSGNFTLSHSDTKNIVFIAGGIGITPFHSILSHLHQQHQEWQGKLLYFNRDDNFPFQAELNSYITNLEKIAYISEQVTNEDFCEIITKEQNFQEKQYYLSGPPAMVDRYRDLLHKLGARRIATDYFLGY